MLSMVHVRLMPLMKGRWHPGKEFWLASYRPAPRRSQVDEGKELNVGKGDRKTAKGKRYNSSYGNVRPHAVQGAASAATSLVDNKPAVKATIKKTVAKKVVAKAGTGRDR